MTKSMTKRFAAATLAVALLSGCSTTRAHKGSVVDDQVAVAIQPGIDNKASVTKLMGRPTFTGQFTPNDWYYVAQDTRQFAFSNPRVTRERVVVVRFDDGGNVTSVQLTGPEYMVAVAPTDRKTPTLGRQRGFFEELFGNVGTVGSIGGQ